MNIDQRHAIVSANFLKLFNFSKLGSNEYFFTICISFQYDLRTTDSFTLNVGVVNSKMNDIEITTKVFINKSKGVLIVIPEAYCLSY